MVITMPEERHFNDSRIGITRSRVTLGKDRMCDARVLALVPTVRNDDADVIVLLEECLKAPTDELDR